MSDKKSNNKRLISAVLIVSIFLSIVPQTVSAYMALAVFSGDGYTIEYNKTGGWGNTDVIEVKITNTGSEVIENWVLAYDDFCGEIEHFWSGAVFVQTDSGLVYVKNAGYNADIAPDGFTTFTYPLNNSAGVPGNIVMVQDRLTVDDSGYSVSVEVDGDWGDLFNGKIVIENHTDEPFQFWELNIDTNFSINTILNSWSAPSANLGNGVYLFKGTRETNTHEIQGNSRMEIGFSGTKTDTPIIVDSSMTEVIINEIDIYWTIFGGESETDGYWLYDFTPDKKAVQISGFATQNYNTDVVIPDEIDGLPVKMIGMGAFMDTAITSVTVPNSVTSIEKFAFSGCGELASITLPNGLTKIEQGVFYNCSSLKTITIPSSVTSIEMVAFGGSGLTEVTILRNVTSIGVGAFADCFSLEKVVFFRTFNDGPLCNIEVAAFSNCDPTVYVQNGMRASYRGANGMGQFKYTIFVNDLTDLRVCGGCGNFTCEERWVPIDFDSITTVPETTTPLETTTTTPVTTTTTVMTATTVPVTTTTLITTTAVQDECVYCKKSYSVCECQFCGSCRLLEQNCNQNSCTPEINKIRILPEHNAERGCLSGSYDRLLIGNGCNGYCKPGVIEWMECSRIIKISKTLLSFTVKVYLTATMI